MALLSESEYKTAFVKQARANKWYARRWEDKFQVGVPDLWVKPTNLPMMIIEAKVVTGYSYAPRPRQLVDLLQLHEPPNTYACVLGIVPSTDKEGITLYFATPRESIEIRPPNNVVVAKEFTTGLLAYYRSVNDARRT